MSDSLVRLEKRRCEVFAQIPALGDFRPGSISATGGRCGNPNCHCRKLQAMAPEIARNVVES
jgi:uncharacterized protein DUF6788